MNEVSVFFGPTRVLIGTHAFGSQHERSGGLGVLLTNAGLINRTGPHGMNVTLARALARIGIPSFRFDMSGLGDSGRPGRPLAGDEQFVRDTRLALDEAQARHGTSSFAMIGFCSGADVAHLAALEDQRLRALLLWDPYIYPTFKSRLLRLRDRVEEFGLLGAAQRALRLTATQWRERLAQRARGAQGEEAPAPGSRYGRTHIPPAPEYAARLRRLLDRGVDILIVYSGGFPGDYNYATQYRDSFKGSGIADRISCIHMPKADHTLTTRASQEAFVRIAVEWLESLRARTQSARSEAPAAALEI